MILGIILESQGNAFAGKEKTGADGRDRSLLSERGSFANYRKVPMVVKAAGESTGGEQLASVGKRWLKTGGDVCCESVGLSLI